MLAAQIPSKLHLRSGAAPSNFASALPPSESELVQQLIKVPYHLGFLDLSAEATELMLENALIEQVERFLLELGQGFAFVGRQHALRVGDDDFFIDLLFFHIPTKRYVVVELKRSAFTPEAAGKLNFYVNVVDDTRCQASPPRWRSRVTHWPTCPVTLSQLFRSSGSSSMSS